MTNDDLAQKIHDEGVDYAATNWTADTLEVQTAQLNYLRARRDLLAVCGLPASDADRLIAQLEMATRVRHDEPTCTLSGKPLFECDASNDHASKTMV